MSDSCPNHHAFEALSKRLSAALDDLEAALERQRTVELAREGLIEELALLRQEKQSLAIELAACQARCRMMEEARDEVIIRLEKASSAVKTILKNGIESE